MLNYPAKRFLIPFWCVTAIIIAAAPAGAQMQGMDMMSPSGFLKFLPPIVSSVKHSPKVPAAGEEVKVTARVGRISFGDDYEFIDTVMLYYSTDYGETWEEIYMEQDEKKTLNWEEYIPGFDDGAEVVYYIKVLDSVGNMALMLPPETSMQYQWFDILDEGLAGRELALRLPHPDVRARERPGRGRAVVFRHSAVVLRLRRRFPVLPL